MITNILMNIEYENLILKSFGEILLYFVIAQTVFTKVLLLCKWKSKRKIGRGGSRAAATTKMECFVIIVNGFQPSTIITTRSILDVAAVLDPPLIGHVEKGPIFSILFCSMTSNIFVLYTFCIKFFINLKFCFE